MSNKKVVKLKKFTLKDLAPRPYTLELKHPGNGSDIGISIEIIGMESAAYITRAKELFIERGDKKPEDVTVNDLDLESRELAISAITGWSDDEFFGGEYTCERAREVILDIDNNWIKDQIDHAQLTRTNFFAV